MTALALDDEPQALSIVQTFAGKVPFLDLRASFTDAFQAIDFLQKNPIDLLFLDVKMPDISGLEFLRSLPQPPLVVFTTAYAEHAVQGFDLDAIDYLLKPFALSRFLKACQKAEEFLKRRQSPSVDYLFVKSGYEQIRVDYDEILYIEGAGNYVVFVFKKNQSSGSRKLASRLTMQEVMTILPLNRFVRSHRSYVVARDKIEKLDRYDVTVGGHVLPIGAIYRENLL